jgi:hypothetical protein
MTFKLYVSMSMCVCVCKKIIKVKLYTLLFFKFKFSKKGGFQNIIITANLISLFEFNFEIHVFELKLNETQKKFIF